MKAKLSKSKIRHKSDVLLPASKIEKVRESRIGRFHVVVDLDISTSGYIEPKKSLKALERGVREKVFQGLRPHEAEI